MNQFKQWSEEDNKFLIKHVLRDYYKKCYYLSQGYYILELWEHDINHNPKGVIENITAVLGRNS